MARHPSPLAPLFALALLGCSKPHQRPATAAPSIRMATLDGARLEVIDWGGAGELLVFVAGLGASAHAFDDFAPRFTDRFHVVGLTRRGHGASEQTAAGYDTVTLAEDLRALGDRYPPLVTRATSPERSTSARGPPEAARSRKLRVAHERGRSDLGT